MGGITCDKFVLCSDLVSFFGGFSISKKTEENKMKKKNVLEAMKKREADVAAVSVRATYIRFIVCAAFSLFLSIVFTYFIHYSSL